MKTRSRLLSAVCTLALCACLEQAREIPGYSVQVLPAGSRVPRAENDELLAKQIATGTSARGPEVSLLTGYAGGREILYWDLGTASDSAKPIWMLTRGGKPLTHFPIVDSLPGDSSYGPMRVLFTAEVTAQYDGELLTSLAALEDAVELGLVREPKREGTFVSYPIVPRDLVLLRPDEPPIEPRELYAKGVIAHYLPLSMPAPLKGPSAPSATAYLLQRQNELSQLDEGARQLDLNDDGDQNDTNTIFDLEAGSEPSSGLWSALLVTVPAAYEVGAVRSKSALFGEHEATDGGLDNDAGTDAGADAGTDAGTSASEGASIQSPLLELSPLEGLLFRPLYPLYGEVAP
jgi:hypothetical protein